MASQEYILTAQREADDRVGAAITTLTERFAVEAVAMPSLPNQVARDYRTMVTTQTMAESLERLVAAAASQPVAVDDEAPAATEPDTGASVTTEAVAPDLSTNTRDELDALAISLGIVDADKLPNKAAVIDAITAAQEQ